VTLSTLRSCFVVGAWGLGDLQPRWRYEALFWESQYLLVWDGHVQYVDTLAKTVGCELIEKID
jgi:hypothetical protein